MYKVLLRQDLVPNIHRFKIAAPNIAKKAQPGQFVIIRVDEKGERIPLTIADWDREEGSITIIFNEVGKTTRKLAALKEGDFITNFVGPLGFPAHIERGAGIPDVPRPGKLQRFISCHPAIARRIAHDELVDSFNI